MRVIEFHKQLHAAANPNRGYAVAVILEKWLAAQRLTQMQATGASRGDQTGNSMGQACINCPGKTVVYSFHMFP